MEASAGPSAAEPLSRLYSLVRRSRAAGSTRELSFLLVNDSLSLLPYRQAVLWLAESGVDALSGVVQPESNAPYVQWITRLCRHLCEQAGPARTLQAGDLPTELAAEWASWWPAHALVLPLGRSAGLALLLRDEAWTSPELALAQEWVAAWWHAFAALRPTRLGPWQRWLSRGHRPNEDGGTPAAPWWRRPVVRWAAAALLVALLPVRLSVLAPGELVPAHPVLVRAPLDGVIGSFHVQPNQLVSPDQPLFGFDEMLIQSRLDVAAQALTTAETEYRQSSQQALADARVKAQLALLTGKIDEKRAEVDYLREQLGRARVTAPQAGIVLFDDPSEWIGRPVSVGERILRIAAPDDVEVEAWLPLGDALVLAPDAEVKLYLNATPLAPVLARLRYLAHDAVLRPDGSYAYRLRASLLEPTAHRVGLRGAAKAQGSWVPLIYWALRRPLATLRVTLGL